MEIEINNEVFFSMVEAQLAEGRRVTIVLRGISMRPTLREGDKLTLEPCGEAAPGDVVLFRYCGHHILHRVISCKGDKYLIQGDNNRSTETATTADIVGRLVTVQRGSSTILVGSRRWRCASRYAMIRKALKNTLLNLFDKRGRKRLRPWYFAALAFLMWAPLNGVGIPLDNYILGLRADHLLHASVFLPCILFLFDLFPRRLWLAWLLALAIGLTTEFGQYLLPYRGFDINDMISNTIGVSLGLLPILHHSH